MEYDICMMMIATSAIDRSIDAHRYLLSRYLSLYELLLLCCGAGCCGVDLFLFAKRLLLDI